MDLGDVFAGGAAAFVIGLLIYLAVSAALVALGVWLTYTIIWRAVRRGMREFHAGRGPVGTALYPPTGSWSLGGAPEPRGAPRAPRPLRDERGPRDW